MKTNARRERTVNSGCEQLVGWAEGTLQKAKLI